MWVVFLSPMLRRMVDYRIGFRAANPILLAPLLVPALSLLPVLMHLPRMRRRAYLPYGLALAGAFCGFLVGTLKLGILAAGYGFATWIVPLSFGFFIALQHAEYPALSRALQRTLVVALLVLSVYGIAQFIRPLPWDEYWIVSGGQSAALDFRPFHLRIFGTLNSFGPFAGVVMAGLIVALSSNASLALRLAAGGAGVVVLLMSQVRACWAALVLASLMLLLISPGRARFRLLPLLAVPMLLLPLVLQSPAGSVLRARLESLSSIGSDGSFIERQGRRSEAWSAILQTPEGAGTGATGMAWVLGGEQAVLIEQGFQDVLYSLGWFGGAAYFTGVLLLVARAVTGGEARSDRFGRASRCAALAIFATSLLGNVFVAVAGLMFWTFLGVHSAARRHMSDSHETIPCASS
jgi:hypothetical protein